MLTTTPSLSVYIADAPRELKDAELFEECLATLWMRLDELMQSNKKISSSEERELRFMLDEIISRKAMLYDK